jgi:hypothetical protein
MAYLREREMFLKRLLGVSYSGRAPQTVIEAVPADD